MHSENRAYLTTKPLIENSPGTQYNSLYYRPYNFQSELVEVTANYGRNRINLSSTGFGSTSTIYIQNVNMNGPNVLELELPTPNADVTYCRGWGLASIAQIQWATPGSQLQQFTGKNMYQALMGQCQTSEQRSELLRLCGEEVLAPIPAVVGQDAPRYRAYVPIFLPWSSMCPEKLYLDTNMYTQNINITISFNASSYFMGGTGTKPNNFVNASYSYRELIFTNPFDSIRTPMTHDRSLSEYYPYQTIMNSNVNTFQGVKESQVLAGVNLNLQSFLDADLLGIMFYVTSQSDSISTAGNSPNPFHSVEITNVRLVYAGQTIYSTIGDEFKLINMFSWKGSNIIQGSYIQPGNTAPFISYPVADYITYIDFARLRQLCTEDQFYNTFRIGNNVINLQFNTPTNDNYNVYCTYIFNSLVKSQGGMSEIQIN